MCITELLGTVTQSSDSNVLIDSLFTTIIVWVNTVLAYNLYYQRKEITDLLNTLKQLIFLQVEEERARRTIFSCSRKIRRIILFLWIFSFIAVLFYVSGKYSLAINTKKPFILNSWYPYDKTKSPYYEITYVFEAYRLIFMMCLIIGNDSLLFLISFFVITLYLILSEKFENIIKLADAQTVDKLAQAAEGQYEYAELFRQELHSLQKGYIEEHIALTK